MHYFRLPSQALWRDRLLKLKAAGYNTVDLYFNWGFHSTKPGQYDFTGIRDIQALLSLTQELGLWVIARPGPYINAEVSGGGFPGWVLADNKMTLRNRKQDASFQWCETYMAAVREWFEQILPFVAKAPNVLFMQIENEYATDELEPDYLQALSKMARELGITVPLSHNDLYTFGCYGDLVDIYGFDHYPTTHFEGDDWRGHVDSMLSTIDQVEAHVRPHCPNRPLYVAEFQAGWFAPWKGPTYDTIRESMGREHLRLITKSLVAQGVTVFNHYMAIGSTNWGYLGSTDTYTSYNFDAPIHEDGHLQPHYFEAKAINQVLEGFPSLAATKRVEDQSWTVSHADTLLAVRESVESEGTFWVFLRNITDQPIRTAVIHPTHCPDALQVTIHPYDVTILPFNVPLTEQVTLEASGLPLLSRWGDVTAVQTTVPGEVRLKHIGGDKLTIQLTPSDEPMSPGLWKDLKLLSLNETGIQSLWHVQTDASTEPEAFLGGEQVGHRLQSSQPTEPPLHHISSTGEITPLSWNPVAPFSIPEVSWTEHPGAWLSEAQAWEAVPTGLESLDLDSLGIYEGLTAYRLRFELGESPPVTLSIKARHFWQVALNDLWLAAGDNWSPLPLVTRITPTELSIPSDAWKTGSVSSPNELFILVDSLGHPKGFNGDCQCPGGLFELLINGKLAHDRLEVSSLKQRGVTSVLSEVEETNIRLPARQLIGHFTLEQDPNTPAFISAGALALQYPASFADRSNIWLNGTLIGRSWSACGAQTQFYLPSGLLQQGSNRLHILAWNHSEAITVSSTKQNDPTMDPTACRLVSVNPAWCVERTP